MNDGFIIKRDKSAEFEIYERNLIITPICDLDHHSAVYIKEESDRIINSNNIQNIIINFAKIEFMDSSGIGVLMGRYKKIADCNGRMFTVNMSNSIERIYLISGLHKIMVKCSSLKEAMDRINFKRQ